MSYKYIIDGKGKLTLKNGAVIVGNFNNGQLDEADTAKIILEDNKEMYYQGEWNKDFEMHGEGKLKISDSEIYEGQFKNNMFDGKGIYKRELGKEEYIRAVSNNWNNNHINGLGKILYYKLKYEGNIINDLPNDKEGKCTLMENDCDIEFIGGFVDGQPITTQEAPEWKVVFKWKNIGTAKKQIREYVGKISTVSINGISMINYRCGEPSFYVEFHGNGKAIYCDGTTYEGNFIRDKREGDFKVTYISGKVKLIKFENDKEKDNLIEAGFKVVKEKSLDILKDIGTLSKNLAEDVNEKFGPKKIVELTNNTITVMGKVVATGQPIFLLKLANRDSIKCLSVFYSSVKENTYFIRLNDIYNLWNSSIKNYVDELIKNMSNSLDKDFDSDDVDDIEYEYSSEALKDEVVQNYLETYFKLINSSKDNISDYLNQLVLGYYVYNEATGSINISLDANEKFSFFWIKRRLEESYSGYKKAIGIEDEENGKRHYRDLRRHIDEFNNFINVMKSELEDDKTKKLFGSWKKYWNEDAEKKVWDKIDNIIKEKLEEYSK